jgi:hypothetical protein
MRSSALISSDLKSITVNDGSKQGSLTIGRRGVLLSVLGNELIGSEVLAELDRSIKAALTGKKPFFEFAAKDLDKNHLCVSYQEQSNTVYVIGIDDLIITLAAPTEIPGDKIKGVAVRLKASTDAGLIAQHVILVRLEGRIGTEQKLAFYLINAAST